MVIDQDFNEIVSLGSWCQTAYQIRKYFGTKAQPFDWWVTPTIGLIEVLESQFSDLFIPSNMRVVVEDAGKAVMCSRYGIMHYHDFDEAKLNGEIFEFLVRAKSINNLSKYSHLITRFLNMSGKVLFIRVGSGTVQYYNKNQELDDLLLVRLQRALQLLLPNCEVHILLLNSYYTPSYIPPNVYHSVVNNYDLSDVWYGSEQGWKEMFESLKIRMVNN